MTRHWQEDNEGEKFDDGLQIVRRLARGTALVDVGCGPGLFGKLARAAGFDAIGIDIQPEIVAGNDGSLKCLPVRALPRESFDVVTLWCVVAHEPDFMSLLRDCYRVLRPGGLIFVETPNMTLWRGLRRLRAALERLGVRLAYHDALGVYTHINHFTVRSLRKALHNAGFTATDFYLVSNCLAAQGIVDRGKRAVFRLSASRLSLSPTGRVGPEAARRTPE